MNKEQHELLESGVWRAVEARRQGRVEEQEQRRQHEQEQREQPEQKERRQEQGEQRRLAAQEHNTGQEQSKQGKGVRFGEEEELGETRAESTDVPEVTGGTTEVRTGRGSAGLVRGGDERRWTDETSRKGKGKGNGGKGEHEGKGGGVGRKGTQQVENLVMDEIQEEKASEGQEQSQEEKRETKGMRWADCEDDEGKEEEEREQ